MKLTEKWWYKRLRQFKSVGGTTSSTRNEKKKSEEQPHVISVDLKFKAKENDTEEKDREVEDVGKQKFVDICSKVKEGRAPNDDMFATINQFLLFPVPIDPTSSHVKSRD